MPPRPLGTCLKLYQNLGSEVYLMESLLYIAGLFVGTFPLTYIPYWIIKKVLTNRVTEFNKKFTICILPAICLTLAVAFWVDSLSASLSMITFLCAVVIYLIEIKANQRNQLSNYANQKSNIGEKI